MTRVKKSTHNDRKLSDLADEDSIDEIDPELDEPESGSVSEIVRVMRDERNHNLSG